MKNDARFLLNKKKAARRTTEIGPRSTIDARKILNQKRANKNPQGNRFAQKNHGKFIKTSKGIFTKSFTATSNSKVPDKRIKVTTDGNILITAKSKDTKVVPQSIQRTSSFNTNILSTGSPIQKSVHQWVPSDIEMDNLEHIGINDLLDMESLPPAVSSNIPTQSPFVLSRMQNSMVADQISSLASLPSKVIVTNLHVSVTKQDIMDLFGVVGLLKTIQMPQPGTAVIDFLDPLDASKACNEYDNRLLDGKLMKCYLDTSMIPQRSLVSQRLGGRIESMTPIASTSSFVSNPRSRYNPRDVRFTVNLT